MAVRAETLASTILRAIRAGSRVDRVLAPVGCRVVVTSALAFGSLTGKLFQARRRGSSSPIG